jgi:hypothetical protein
MKTKYHVEKIDNTTAQRLVIENHYLHRKCSASYSFGIFDNETGLLLGCVVFGTPASRLVQKGVCGDEEADNVIELTRLWIDDCIEKNAESFLVSYGLRWLRKNKIKQDIIISFSDTGAGHYGCVYQATNFLYTGTNHIQKDWYVDGKMLHPRHFKDRFGSVREAKQFYGERMVAKERTVKHRYVFFNCSKARKKQLLEKLRYVIQPYPKGIGSEIGKISYVRKERNNEKRTESATMGVV